MKNTTHILTLAAALVSLALATPAPAANPTGGAPTRIIEGLAPGSVFPGPTRTAREVTIGTSFDATLMTLLVREGAVIRKGDLIAKLDDRVAVTSLAIAREEAAHTARVDRARAEMERAKRVQGRTYQAHKRGAANDEELAEAKTIVTYATADYREAIETRRAAQLKAEEAQARLEEFSLRAPFDAIVLKVPAEEGAVLRSGDPIAEIASVGRITVDLYLPAAAAMSLDTSANYALRLESPIDRVLLARVKYVEPRIDPTSNTMRAVFEFDTPDGLLPAGLLVSPADRFPNDDEIAFMRGDDSRPRIADVDDND